MTTPALTRELPESRSKADCPDEENPVGSTDATERRRPVDPRLLRRAAPVRWLLIMHAVIGTLRAAALVLIAWWIAYAVGTVFAERTVQPVITAIPWLVTGFLVRGLLSWLGELVSVRASSAVKSQLRTELTRAYLRPDLDQPDRGTVTTLITKGLDDLDGYFAKFLPQLVLAVAVPVVIMVAIGGRDLLSAVIIALTLPLIPIFMILVGWTTEKLTSRRWRVQARLAHHFVDLVSGLPTLRVFGRATAQAEGLRRSGEAHREETMATLRIALLSALILELLATLSVALVAVVMGLRVINGDVDLVTGLFVLVLAPEAYLPLRQVGAHYHDGADGAAAAQSALDLIESGLSESDLSESDLIESGLSESGLSESGLSESGRAMAARVRASTDEGNPRQRGMVGGATGTVVRGVAGTSGVAPGVEVRLRGVSFGFSGRRVLDRLDLYVPAGALTVLTGPSGAGKSTVLQLIMGWARPDAGTITIGDRHPSDARDLIAWVGQHPALIRGTVADNVRLGWAEADDHQITEALSAARVDLDPHRQVDEGVGLSAGELRRIALARAWLRIRYGGGAVMILDEPTAGLDQRTELEAISTVRALGVTALIVSHRPAVLAAADRVLRLERS